MLGVYTFLANNPALLAFVSETVILGLSGSLLEEFEEFEAIPSFFASSAFLSLFSFLRSLFFLSFSFLATLAASCASLAFLAASCVSLAFLAAPPSLGLFLCTVTSFYANPAGTPAR